MRGRNTYRRLLDRVLLLILVLTSLGCSWATTCSVGQYQTGTSCTECPAGMYNPTAGSSQCYTCEMGRYSASGASSCSICGGSQVAVWSHIFGATPYECTGVNDTCSAFGSDFSSSISQVASCGICLPITVVLGESVPSFLLFFRFSFTVRFVCLRNAD